MGAVNYFTSDYITMGFNLNAYDEADFESYEEMDDCKRWDIEEAYEDLERLIDKYSFYYFHIAIKPGYYEGFSIDIESNFPIAFDGWEDKREAQKEITQIKAFLMDCVDMGLCQVWPGWVTSYKSKSDTIKAIASAIREMREEAKATPTWAQYERSKSA